MPTLQDHLFLPRINSKTGGGICFFIIIIVLIAKLKALASISSAGQAAVIRCRAKHLLTFGVPYARGCWEAGPWLSSVPSHVLDSSTSSTGCSLSLPKSWEAGGTNGSCHLCAFCRMYSGLDFGKRWPSKALGQLFGLKPAPRTAVPERTKGPRTSSPVNDLSPAGKPSCSIMQHFSSSLLFHIGFQCDRVCLSIKSCFNYSCGGVSGCVWGRLAGV